MILIPTEREYFTNYYGFYFKDAEAKAKNKVSYMKYIYCIQMYRDGHIEINGKMGPFRYYDYTLNQAIKKYNADCKAELKRRGE
jgi:hypothetical protein